jgi:hypothetical protein
MSYAMKLIAPEPVVLTHLQEAREGLAAVAAHLGLEARPVEE